VPALPQCKTAPLKQSKSGVEDFDSDSDCVVVSKQTKGKHCRKQQESGAEMQEITKQFHVSEIRDIMQLPSTCWTVPRKDEGEDFAYRRKWYQMCRSSCLQKAQTGSVHETECVGHGLIYLFKMNLDGKHSFIGCQNYRLNE
jgi:hypothetical protein